MLTYLDLYRRVRVHLEKTASPAVQQLIEDYEYGEGEDLDFIVSLAFEEQIGLPETLCEQLVTLQDDYAKPVIIPCRCRKQPDSIYGNNLTGLLDWRPEL